MGSKSNHPKIWHQESRMCLPKIHLFRYWLFWAGYFEKLQAQEKPCKAAPLQGRFLSTKEIFISEGLHHEELPEVCFYHPTDFDLLKKANLFTISSPLPSHNLFLPPQAPFLIVAQDAFFTGLSHPAIYWGLTLLWHSYASNVYKMGFLSWMFEAISWADQPKDWEEERKTFYCFVFFLSFLPYISIAKCSLLWGWKVCKPGQSPPWGSQGLLLKQRAR